MTTNLIQRYSQAQPGWTCAQNWDAIMARQQAIYEELLANHELDADSPESAQTEVVVSVHELTRDLSGWSSQWPAQLYYSANYPALFSLLSALTFWS